MPPQMFWPVSLCYLRKREGLTIIALVDHAPLFSSLSPVSKLTLFKSELTVEKWLSG